MDIGKPIDFDVDRRKICVSGRKYQCDIIVLLRSDLFKEAFTQNPDLGKDDYFWIDRSPLMFEHAYAYMINPDYLYPLEVEEEIAYYGLPFTKRIRPDLKGPPGPPGENGTNGIDGAWGQMGMKGDPGKDCQCKCPNSN